MYHDLCPLLKRKGTTQQLFLFRKQIGKKDVLDIAKGSRATFYFQLQLFLQKLTSYKSFLEHSRSWFFNLLLRSFVENSIFINQKSVAAIPTHVI